MRCAVEGAGAVDRQTRAWFLPIRTAGEIVQHSLSPVVLSWVQWGELEYRTISVSKLIGRAASNCRAVERAARIHEQLGTGVSAIVDFIDPVVAEAMQHRFGPGRVTRARRC